MRSLWFTLLLLFVSPLSAQEEWIPFQPGTDNYAPSPIDLRSLNEKFAGEHGFIQAKDGQFVSEKTGTPIRFWAVNSGGDIQTKSPEEIQKAARWLAKHGVNMIRAHGRVCDDTGEVSPAKIADIMKLVDGMKKEGIYTHLSIYFPLWFTPKPDNKFLKGYDGKKHPFAAHYFNPEFKNEMQEWWKALLTTRGADGKTLLEEPAVSSVELINEDSFLFWTFNYENVPPAQMSILEKMFGDWASKKYGGVDKAIAAWGGKIDRDHPEDGRLGFRGLYNIFKDKTLRDQDTVRFLAETQQKFYADMADYIRKLGFKGMICASNWITANQQVLDPVERYTYTPCDFTDRHGYFSCDHKGQDAGWSIRNGHTYFDRSALRFDGAEPGKPKVFSNPVMNTSYNNMPSMLSETTFERPNRYRTEAPWVYSVYGSLQRMDCIVNFAFDGPTWSTKPGFWMQPWTVMSPTQLGQFPAAALIYRKGLVKTGDVMLELNLGIDDILSLKGTPLPESLNLDELRKADLPKNGVVHEGTTIDPLIHFTGQVHVNVVPTGNAPKLKDTDQLIDHEKGIVRSSTGEIELDYNDRILRVNTPQAIVAVGNLSLPDMKVGPLGITTSMDQLAVALVSLDGEPLTSSHSILLQVMSEERNTGWSVSGGDTKTITNIGKDPWQIKPITGTLELPAPMSVTSLDANGYTHANLGTSGKLELQPDIIYYHLTR